MTTKRMCCFIWDVSEEEWTSGEGTVNGSERIIRQFLSYMFWALKLFPLLSFRSRGCGNGLWKGKLISSCRHAQSLKARDCKNFSSSKINHKLKSRGDFSVTTRPFLISPSRTTDGERGWKEKCIPSCRLEHCSCVVEEHFQFNAFALNSMFDFKQLASCRWRRGRILIKLNMKGRERWILFSSHLQWRVGKTAGSVESFVAEFAWV